MACEQDGVVWKKPANPLVHQSDEDVWDDRALIKAYDKAVAQLRGDVLSESSGSKHYRSECGKRKKKKKSKKSNEVFWKVGSKCLAVYSEDGLYYEATIMSMNTEAGTCYVHFDFYHNEEEVETRQLLPQEKKNSLQTVPHSDNMQHKRNSDREVIRRNAENRVDGWQISDLCYAPSVNGTYLQAVINSFLSKSNCKVTFVKSRLRKEVKVSQLRSSSDSTFEPGTHERFSAPHDFGIPLNTNFTSPRSMFTQPSFAGPVHSSVSGLVHSSFPEWPNSRRTQHSSQNRIPPIPPPPFPPPPVLTDNVISGDEEALANMLMSWYMNGYHTGFYQGTKQAQKTNSMKRSDPAEASLLDSST